MSKRNKTPASEPTPHVCPDCQDKLGIDGCDCGACQHEDDDGIDYTALMMQFVHNSVGLAQMIHDYRFAANRDGDGNLAKMLLPVEEALVKAAVYMGSDLGPPEPEDDEEVTTHAN
jgi:predicted amidophosphoribosyltransferase